MNFSTCRILAALLLCGCLTRLPAQEWTRFGGPNGTGISDARTIPSHWTAADFDWKVLLPGPGHSSPVLWGEKIFLVTGDETGNQVVLLCFNAPDGRELWRQTFPVARYHRNALNTLASGTPAVDAQRVYACWTEPARFTVAAFDHDGKQAWFRDLGPFASQHGGGASPILYQDLVIVADQQDGESFLVALDAASGEIRWKTPRKTAEANYVHSHHQTPDQHRRRP